MKTTIPLDKEREPQRLFKLHSVLTIRHWKKNVQKMEYGESTECLYIFSVCGAYNKALYEIQQKTGTELPYFLECGMFGQIVDQKCSVGSGRVKKVQRVKKVHRYLSYLNSHQVLWYHFLHQGKNLCQYPFSH